MAMTRDVFDAMRKHVRAICGIDLGEDKEYLVEQRFAPLAESLGLGSIGGLVARIERGCDERLRDEIIAAITTNETSFFRDELPFKAFREVILPELVGRGEERLKRSFVRMGPKVSILSAGASTGQEAYCLSMLIHERFPMPLAEGLKAEDFLITGGDIDPLVLARAIAGEYSDAEIARGLPASYRDRFFARQGNLWAVNAKVRSLVEFRRVNFTEPFRHLGAFDCIFCRNILIYFDVQTKTRILDQFLEMLVPGGYLVLGSTESLYGLSQGFESCHVGGTLLFRKPA